MSSGFKRAKHGFYVAIKDHNNHGVKNVWLWWLAVIPTEENGFRGGGGIYNNGARISFSPSFPFSPAYVLSAESGTRRKPDLYAASAVNNRRNGFTLSLIRYDGSTRFDAGICWLGYARSAR